MRQKYVCTQMEFLFSRYLLWYAEEEDVIWCFISWKERVEEMFKEKPLKAFAEFWISNFCYLNFLTWIIYIFDAFVSSL